MELHQLLSVRASRLRHVVRARRDVPQVRALRQALRRLGGRSKVYDDRATYRRALRRPEFLGLYIARVLSDWGDQLARVSIAALVLRQSHSALFAASAFAVSLLPQVFGQALLGPLADWFPRRTLMVGCDVLRFVGLVLLFLLRVGHPPVVEDEPLGRGRTILAIVALIVFLLCFMPFPAIKV